VSHDKNYKAEKMALPISKLKALLNKKQAKRFDIPDRDGMSVRVSEYRSLTFQYRYRYHNKATRIALGRYPYIFDQTSAREDTRITSNVKCRN